MYELTQDCRFGNKGTIVAENIYSKASFWEKMRYFKKADYKTEYGAGYSSNESSFIDTLGTSMLMSSDFNFDTPSKSIDNSFDFGGGYFGGGGGGSDWGSSSSDSPSSDSSSYDSSSYNSSSSSSDW